MAEAILKNQPTVTLHDTGTHRWMVDAKDEVSISSTHPTTVKIGGKNYKVDEKTTEKISAKEFLSSARFNKFGTAEARLKMLCGNMNKDRNKTGLKVMATPTSDLVALCKERKGAIAKTPAATGSKTAAAHNPAAVLGGKNIPKAKAAVMKPVAAPLKSTPAKKPIPAKGNSTPNFAANIYNKDGWKRTADAYYKTPDGTQSWVWHNQDPKKSIIIREKDGQVHKIPLRLVDDVDKVCRTPLSPTVASTSSDGKHKIIEQPTTYTAA